MKKLSKLFSIPVLIISLFLVSVASCKKDKKEDLIDLDDSFDKAGMLSNIGENCIVASYSQLKASLDSLQIATNVFVGNPTLLTLIDLQTQFNNAYLSYQQCSVFEFGPAENENFRVNLNTFPCDTIQINSNIIAGTYDLASAANIDAKGFPAIDFLLFNGNSNASILNRFLTDSAAINANNYLVNLVNELKTKTDAVNTVWSSSGGNYLSVFKANTGSDVGSSIGMLVNQLNFDFELLKNAKVGIPLGKKNIGQSLA